MTDPGGHGRFMNYPSFADGHAGRPVVRTLVPCAGSVYPRCKVDGKGAGISSATRGTTEAGRLSPGGEETDHRLLRATLAHRSSDRLALVHRSLEAIADGGVDLGAGRRKHTHQLALVLKWMITVFLGQRVEVVERAERCTVDSLLWFANLAVVHVAQRSSPGHQDHPHLELDSCTPVHDPLYARPVPWLPRLARLWWQVR